MWRRKPKLDKRIARGDDFAGDAWVNILTGTVRYVAVGVTLNEQTSTVDPNYGARSGAGCSLPLY